MPYRLDPDDPENLLSPEARERIRYAYLESSHIRNKALASILTRYESDPDRKIEGFDAYRASGPGYIEWTEARLEAARTVLRVVAEEYGRINLPARRLQEILDSYVSSAVYSLELSQFHATALSSEVELLIRRPRATNESTPAEKPESASIRIPLTFPRSITSPSAVARIENYRAEKSLTQGDFAAAAKIGERTFRHILKTSSATPRTWAEIAWAMGMTTEELLKP
jgi:hypothetical protein